MPDFSFTPISDLSDGWQVLGLNHAHQIAVNSRTGNSPYRFERHGNQVIVILSQQASSDNVLEAIQKYRSHFLAHLGVTAGCLWNTQTDEFCIFRDPFGFIPVLGMPQNQGWTTSPELQETACQQQPYHREWLDRFLECRDTLSRDDLFVGTARIRPGEMFYCVQKSLDDFLERFISQKTEDLCTNKRYGYFDIWSSRSYKSLPGTREELAEALRHELISAADRICVENPCFTLSGGLDSSGILACWYQNHPGNWDVVSLISPKHASCDESHELDILEKAFPIRLHRIVMDEAWPLSKPQLYRQFRAYGPLCSPGIESSLSGYQAIFEQLGSQTIITGFGGNAIVKVRPEALWRDLICRGSWSSCLREFKALNRQDAIALTHRILGNLCHGNIRKLAYLAHLRKASHLQNTPGYWLAACFRAQFPQDWRDPVCFLSHEQERAWMPLSWEWEYSVRAMDCLARQTKHRFYDPLFDLKLYDFCACIPPEYFLYSGDYRTIYREALTPLLPQEIIHHPKCQSFDDLMHDGLAVHGKTEILRAIQTFSEPSVLNTEKLGEIYESYCRDVERGEANYPLIDLWRSLSLCLWSSKS